MSPPAIEVDNLGIYFKIYHQKGLPFKDAFISYGQDLLRRVIHPSTPLSRTGLFWAIRSTSFAVEKGQTIGIIGENGSGKSTLLKTIAGIFRPDEGHVVVSGKIGALIELGAGFHPDLTGRENIYLNGSILGITKKKIDLIYDDIVKFSELEEFIDTPIKNYSSGMKVRLGFSVAVHLNPDILLVDEVLAVGDMAFRMKCLEKMTEFKKRGVTTLLVSHDLATVRSFCEKVILLSHGTMVDYGPANDVCNRYFKMIIEERQKSGKTTPILSEMDLSGNESGGADVSVFAGSSEFQKRAAFQRVQNGKASFANIQLLDEYEREIASVEYEQEVILRMAVEVHEDIPRLGYGYHIRDRNGKDIIYSDSLIEGKTIENAGKGQRFIIDWKFRLSLMQGNYSILCVLSKLGQYLAADSEFCDLIPVAYQFMANPRSEGSLYGAVHIENTITVTTIAR